jgi:hypothetical protein
MLGLANDIECVMLNEFSARKTVHKKTYFSNIWRPSFLRRKVKELFFLSFCPPPPSQSQTHSSHVSQSETWARLDYGLHIHRRLRCFAHHWARGNSQL